MANGKATNEGDPTELLRKILIVQLGLAGVPQQQIRTVVGGSMGSVNAIVKHLRIKTAPEKKGR